MFDCLNNDRHCRQTGDRQKNFAPGSTLKSIILRYQYHRFKYTGCDSTWTNTFQRLQWV